MKKAFYLITILSITIYSFIIGIFYFWQDNIIFHPETTYHPPPKSYNIDQHFIRYGETDSLHLWHYKNNSFHPTVLYFSGNSFNISHRIFHIDLFKEIGVNAIMFDYRGYGLSSGSIDSKDSFYESAGVAFQFLLKKLKIPKDQIIFWGHSMGAPVATKILGSNNIRAIILESPVTRIEDIGKKNYPFIPISYILKYDFDTYKYINDSDSPLFLIHSKDDETVPFLFAQDLFEFISRDNKQILEISGSHRFGSYNSYQKYYNGIRKFLNSIN